MQIEEARYQIPFELRHFTPCGGNSVSFEGKLSTQASIQTFIPSSLFFTALPPPPASSLPQSVLPRRQPHGCVVPVCLAGTNAVLLT